MAPWLLLMDPQMCEGRRRRIPPGAHQKAQKLTLLIVFMCNCCSLDLQRGWHSFRNTITFGCPAWTWFWGRWGPRILLQNSQPKTWDKMGELEWDVFKDSHVSNCEILPCDWPLPTPHLEFQDFPLCFWILRCWNTTLSVNSKGKTAYGRHRLGVSNWNRAPGPGQALKLSGRKLSGGGVLSHQNRMK